MCVQKSKYVTFSSAFSSRYAKTRNSQFHKVVRQHTESMAGSIISVLSEIYLAFQQWKNFKNPLRIDKVIAMSLVYYFFGDTVYMYCNLALGLPYANKPIVYGGFTELGSSLSFISPPTRSSAAADRPRDASCR